MTLEKAIKELTEPYNERQLLISPAFMKALTLGIEALNFRQRWEDQEGDDDFPLLPGETIE